jgi:hypothetical protein
METVDISECLFKAYYENIESAQDVVCLLEIGDKAAVVDCTTYEAMPIPDNLPPEAMDMVNERGLELAEPEELPNYEIKLV